MIRAYEDKDIEELLDTWYQASSVAHPFMDEAFLAKERKNVREIYIPNTVTSVYEEEGHVVGFIAMIGNEVGAIFVQPGKQGAGIGFKLMNHVAQIHKELEVEVFEANAIGRGFYEKYGFKFLKEYIHEETNQKLLRLKFG
jgi:putative acetyltransferase